MNCFRIRRQIADKDGVMYVSLGNTNFSAIGKKIKKRQRINLDKI